jgi:hypothetical protein
MLNLKLKGLVKTLLVATFIDLMLVFYLLILFFIWDFHTGRTLFGPPIASDFANYWTASSLALSGNPADAYDINKLFGFQMKIFGASSPMGVGWYYPPTFLLIVLPLALLPYLPALFTWVASTLAVESFILYKISPTGNIFLLSLFFTGNFVNFYSGQNGYLSASLLGGGLLLLDAHPVAGGLLLGMMSYKPNLAFLIPLALIAGRRWRALLSAGASALTMVLLSFMVLGYQVWIEYWKISAVPLILSAKIGPWVIMPTIYSTVLSLGFDLFVAYTVQGLVMAIVALLVAWAWHREADFVLRASILTLGIPLFTPYAFTYDLAILSLPLVWLWVDGQKNGRYPGETLLLFLGWISPYFGQYIWSLTLIPEKKVQITSLILLALFFLTAAKVRKESKHQIRQNNRNLTAIQG